MNKNNINKEDKVFYEKIDKLYSSIAMHYCQIEQKLFFESMSDDEDCLSEECNKNEELGWYLAKQKLIKCGYDMDKYFYIKKQIFDIYSKREDSYNMDNFLSEFD